MYVHVYMYVCVHVCIYIYIGARVGVHMPSCRRILFICTVQSLYYMRVSTCAERSLECTQLHVQCAVWSALSTQCTLNPEHSNALSTQCTRSNGHSALSATHLLCTKVPVRALCVVPCAREPRRPPWASFSLSLPLTWALPRLDLPVSVLSCDGTCRNPRARTGIS